MVSHFNSKKSGKRGSSTVYVIRNSTLYHTFPAIYRQECVSVRQELSQRHSEDSKAALSELASLKDSAMKQAKQKWEEERAILLKKVTNWHTGLHTY